MFLDLAATSSPLIFASFAFQCFLNYLDKLYTCKGDDRFFLSMFIFNRLNRAAIFSAQKGKTIYDCHLLECVICT